MIGIENLTILTPKVKIEQGMLIFDSTGIRFAGPAKDADIPANTKRVDGTGLTAVPGFIDMQINGGFDCDFTVNPQTIWEVGAKLVRYGVTTFLPTVITSPPGTIQKAIKVWRDGSPVGWLGASPLGYHIEGPFLNPLRKGAHDFRYLRLPDSLDVQGWTAENGIRLVTLAPELPGAGETIRALIKQGIRVSAGHSDASYEDAQKGFREGITCGTHLFNAMAPLGHRQPNLPGALLSTAGIYCGLIADGIHLHPATVALAYRAKGRDQLILVTDAMAALGMAVGRYQLGEFSTIVDETSARLDDGTLAGSLLSMDSALRNICDFAGVPLTEAIYCCTMTPAHFLGLQDRGMLEPGKRADLVLLDSEQKIHSTYVAGKLLYCN